MPATIVVLLVAVVTLAGIYDIRFRKIPNWLNVTGVILGLVTNTLLGGWHGLSHALLGLGLALFLYLPLYAIRGMGAGDVKLMAAIGALAGPWYWFLIFLVTSVLGGIASVVLMAFKKRVGDTCWNLWFIVSELLHARLPFRGNPQLDIRHKRALRMPHGAVIASAAIGFVIFRAAAASALTRAPH